MITLLTGDWVMLVSIAVGAIIGGGSILLGNYIARKR